MPNVKSKEAGLKNQLARALADYDNLRKRTEEERIVWVKFATQKFIQSLLPILDIFESAQKHLEDQGLAIGISEFKDILKDEGLVEIRPSQENDFDANLHEAIDIVKDESKNGKIAEVVLSGWKFKDGPIVRHAKVKVFKKAS